MRRNVLLLFGLMATSIYGQSIPPAMTANDLNNDCKVAVAVSDGKISSDPVKSFEQAAQMGRCSGYMAGFADANKRFLIAPSSTSPSIPSNLLSNALFCPPPQVTVGQFMKVFIKYMDDHPEDLHRYAGEMLGVAFLKTFPCSKPSGQ